MQEYTMPEITITKADTPGLHRIVEILYREHGYGPVPESITLRNITHHQMCDTTDIEMIANGMTTEWQELLAGVGGPDNPMAAIYEGYHYDAPWYLVDNVMQAVHDVAKQDYHNAGIK